MEAAVTDVATQQQQQLPPKYATPKNSDKDDIDDASCSETQNGCADLQTNVAHAHLLPCCNYSESTSHLRDYNSLPLFVYATSASTMVTSADGIGFGSSAMNTSAAAVTAVDVNAKENDAYDIAQSRTKTNGITAINGTNGIMDCLPLGSSASHHHQLMAGTTSATSSGAAMLPHTVVPTMVATANGVAYQHHLNLNHHLNQHHHLLSHHSPYSNNYPLHHSSSHHNIHSEQTKSLQELQHEVGALLEFRDLVIETFPDLKHKMASISSQSSNTATATSVGSSSVSTANATTTNGGTSLVSRREWEPGIRNKRKSLQKEPSTTNAGATTAAVAGELSSSSLTRSRSNSHSGKKEPKSGENNNGSVVQDSGFSTETSSSKEGHSASSTNGALTGALAANRLSSPEADDELLNLLDVIHRKSCKLRDEVEQLQNYERQNLCGAAAANTTADAPQLTASTTTANSSANIMADLTPKTFREHVERINKEDIKQLRKERDRLLDKLAEMEAETLAGRIKAAKMNEQVEELINVKKDLEEQLKIAMAQKLELSSRVQQLQLQQQQMQSKSSSSQSDYSSQRNFLSSATTVLSTDSGIANLDNLTTATTMTSRRSNTFQPVVVEQRNEREEDTQLAFHQSVGSDSKQQQQQQQTLGRLDGVVSNPGTRNSKCKVADSKRFAAILLETSVIELQRHLLTLTVQNQVLMQKLEQSTKSKTHLVKRLDKSKEDVEDLRFQLEEKNIELEGTKAQLRVLESRIHSTTPSSVANTNSFLHSQNDFETNRSSASTTLMLSRRNAQDSVSSQMPAPATQISTPSMKAMVHLPMDELQQHSSSTESAHENEMQPMLSTSVNSGSSSQSSKLLSTSVGGVSPFEQRMQQTLKKFVNSSAAYSKPSKIPLPGNKLTNTTLFATKPPTGRPSTAGARTTNMSNVSSKSALSRSTGNLLHSKSPNSLKRADSAQSIRKDNNNSSSSFSNSNTSRSSTSSSIPMAITPYSNSNASKSYGAMASSTPSPRVLQNSPLPKLKRETLTSRVRHLDSLSRVHQQQERNNDGLNSSYLVGSTPKPSSIAAQLNSTLRKDLQLNANNANNRRVAANAAASNNSNSTMRRFVNSSNYASSTVSSRAAALTRSSQEHNINAAAAIAAHEQHSNGSVSSNSNSANNVASDSESGKVRTLKSTFLGWLKI